MPCPHRQESDIRPFKLKIGQLEYEVVTDPDEVESNIADDALGETRHLEGKILLRTRHRGAPIPEDRVVETLVHELLHAAVFVSGIRSAEEITSELEERMVSAVTGPLYAALTTSRELRNHLRGMAVS